MTLAIDMVSDVVCPWCYIGKSRLEKAIALRPDVATEVHFRPYFLNPWVPREGMSRDEYLTTKFGDIARIEREANSAKESGIDGVPCFILGGTISVHGAQSPEHLAQAIDHAVQEYAKREAAE